MLIKVGLHAVHIYNKIEAAAGTKRRNRPAWKKKTHISNVRAKIGSGKKCSIKQPLPLQEDRHIR